MANLLINRRTGVSGRYSFFKYGFWIAVWGLTACTVSGNVTETPKRGPAREYLQALLKFVPWAESVWHTYPKIPESGYFGDGRSTGNGGIRGTCGIALSYAVLVRAFPRSPEHAHWLKRIEEALRYAEKTHRGNPDSMVATDGRKWGVISSSPAEYYGPGWQSGAWAASMGFAAALVEHEIDPSVVKGCKRVVAQEAEWQSNFSPASGYKLDTKSEENGWKSNILTLAAAWMPDDSRAKKWLRAAKLYLANTYTVPSDSSGPLRKWIKTQTLFPSYAVQNHGFYHPTYQMVGGMSLGDSYLMAKVINPKVAREIAPFAAHNVEAVWHFLQKLLLPDGDLGYPSGLDWSLNDFEHVSYLAWLAAHFKDPTAQWAEPRLVKQILYRQSVNGDGRFVGESCPHGFYREAVEAVRIAKAYLQEKIAGFPQYNGEPPENNFIVNYPEVGLIIQRSDSALMTVSYGTRTMALVYPLKGKTPARRFFISPNTATLLGGDRGKTKLKSFKRTTSGFKAILSLNNKEGRKSQMIIRSIPDAIVFLEIPADRSKLSRQGWLLSAIENDALSGGKRTIFWKSNSSVIQERSGSTATITSGWLDVDNWMGFAVIPRGSLVYQAASGYNRNGAAEDYLYYRPGNTAVPRAVIVLPGEDSKGTDRIYKSLNWSVSGKACNLSFISPKGGRVTIKEGF